MAGMRLPPEDSDVSQARPLTTTDLISDDDRSVAADSWSIKSDYGSTLDDDQRHADASEALSAATYRAASDYSSDKEEPDAEPVSSMLGFQSYWDAAYADELANFREHGHAGEVWFGADVMEMVASWTKGLCNDISRGHLLNHLDDAISEPPEQGEKDLSNWSVLDVGTGNGLLLQEFAKQGFCDLIGTDYSEGAIDLAQSLANRDGFSSIRFLVDDVLETKLDRKFQLVIDKGTLDAIGLHPDGSVKRIMYWDSISKLVAPGGLLEVDNFNQRSFAASQEPECPVNQEACRDTPQFCHLDHIRSCPTFMFGGSPVQTNLTISLAAPSRILNLFPAGVFEEMDSSKTISSFQQGSRSLHLLPKAPKPVLAAGLDTNASSISQIHVARQPVEGQIKNQLLPHYWPR